LAALDLCRGGDPLEHSEEYTISRAPLTTPRACRPKVTRPSSTTRTTRCSAPPRRLPN